ncbi:MAG: hypothetical protein KGP28_04780 [Bdellovibrionales bacterium]|nr:hypothetical protein [Bdellovibrionales bacterium]
MEQEIAFLINERSGHGEAKMLAEAARRGLPDARIFSTTPESALELTELCKNLSSQDIRAAVVFGGDGTLNYALRGLIENAIPLYPYPSGTANDLASENGITGSPEQLGRLVGSGSVRDVRVLQVNGIPFSTISGIGIGSKVCDEFNRMRGRFRWIQMLPKRLNCEIYSLLATRAMIRNWGKGHLVRLISDEVNEVVHTSILMVCNQSTLAGNLRVAPGQTPDQDTFTVLYHRDPCGTSTLKALAKMKIGQLDSTFRSFRTSRLRIESLNGEPLQAFGDGEILTSRPTLDFGIHPKRLRIFSDC